MPLDDKTRPLYINRALFLCGFFGQSNFDLESSGGPLAHMRNNVLVRYSVMRMHRTAESQEEDPRFLFKGYGG